MARQKMKRCTISNKKFSATKDNFYFSKSSSDSLHPYHKNFDDFRRTHNLTVSQVRKLVKLING